MSLRDARTTAVVTGWAIVGLLIGHIVAYDLVYPDGHVHAQVLAATGHGWLSLVEPSIVLACLLALVAGFAGSRNGIRREARFRVLAGIQIGAFLGMELLERVGSGLSFGDIGHELVGHGLWLVLLIGIVAQLVTAWLASAISRSVADVAAGTPRPQRHRHARSQVLAPVARFRRAAAVLHANPIRGPPSRITSHMSSGQAPLS